VNSPGLNMGTPENGGVGKPPEDALAAPEISPPAEPEQPHREVQQDANPEELIPPVPRTPEVVEDQQVISAHEVQGSPVNAHFSEQDITEGPMLDVTDADRLAETINQISNQ